MCIITNFLRYLFGIPPDADESDNEAETISEDILSNKFRIKVEPEIKNLMCEVIDTNNYLPDDVIDFVSRNLRNDWRFLKQNLKGLIEAANLFSTDTAMQNILGDDGESKFIQIFYLDQHWITISNRFSRHAHEIIIYDSRYHSPNYKKNKFKFAFSKLVYCEPLANQNYVHHVPVIIAPVQQQNDAISCGIFAIAFAIEIIHGVPPETVCFDAKKMREHLTYCIMTNKFKRFPKTKENCKRLEMRVKDYYLENPLTYI